MHGGPLSHFVIAKKKKGNIQQGSCQAACPLANKEHMWDVEGSPPLCGLKALLPSAQPALLLLLFQGGRRTFSRGGAEKQSR